jgi:phospholipase/carboxylesterase
MGFGDNLRFEFAGENVLDFHIKEPQQPAKSCIIWMHGLGADANDMAGLANELNPNNAAIRHIFLNAPSRPVTINNGLRMRAWYDIYDLGSSRREDKEGILASEIEVLQIMDAEIEKGISSLNIWLAGFSQGGAMALHCGLRLSMPIGGIISLSAYLPLASECTPRLPRETPMFLAHGSYDSVVLPSFSKLTTDWLASNGYSKLSIHEYPMEHSICSKEVQDLSQWLNGLLKGEV